MSFTKPSPEHEVIQLREVFNKELERRLVEDAINFIKPTIEQHAKAVVAQMETQVFAQYEESAHRYVMQFVGRVPDETANET